MALLFAYAIACAFWLSYLIASMGLQVLWSFALACLDAHALRMKRDMHTHVLVSLFVVGDWVPSSFSTLFLYLELHMFFGVYILRFRMIFCITYQQLRENEVIDSYLLCGTENFQ